MFIRDGSVEDRARPLRRHLLPVCLVASAALHAAVGVVVTLPASDDRPLPPRVLEVVLVQSEPPRPSPAEPEKPVPPHERAPERSHASPRVAASEFSLRPAPPVLALPEPATATVPEVAAAQAPEKRAPAAELKTDIASAAPTLPSFSAAYLRNPAPRYPLEARRAGEQGTVTLRVLVTREGRPSRVDVERTSGSARLDAAALEAVRAWRFVPARQGSETVESWVLVPIVFRLEGVS